MDKNVLDALYKKTGIGAKISDVISAIQGHEASDGHDNRYYTEAETDALLDAKADVGHNHPPLAAPSFRAVRVANQVVTPGANRLVEFDDVDVYNGAAFGSGPLPPVHLPDPGLWLYHLRLANQSIASGVVLYVYLNDSAYQLYQIPPNINYGLVSALIETVQDDTVSCYISVPSTITIQGGSLWTSFHGVQIG